MDARRNPRLRMMLPVELGVRNLPRRGTPGRRTRGAVGLVEKLSSIVTPSRQRPSEIAEFFHIAYQILSI